MGQAPCGSDRPAGEPSYHARPAYARPPAGYAPGPPLYAPAGYAPGPPLYASGPPPYAPATYAPAAYMPGAPAGSFGAPGPMAYPAGVHGTPGATAYSPGLPSTSAPVAPVGSTAGTKDCRHGVECCDFSESHRAEFRHPEGTQLACQYGSKCFRKNLEHLKQFVHPGDRNYRIGMVHFPTRKGKKVRPEFPTLRDLFNYCDPDESGNISREEFQGAWDHLCHLPPEMFGVEEGNRHLETTTCDEAWLAAAGEERSHLTFVQFAKWASDAMIVLPVGIDLSEGAPRACRFDYAGKKRCPCIDFKASAHSTMCECGHKSSSHFSDVALMSLEEQETVNKINRAKFGRKGSKSFIVPFRQPGFTFVTDKAVLAALQDLLTQTLKTTDNWTRDRGCKLHGRNGCDWRCAFINKCPVPTGYQLIRAERNRNPPLWQTYATTRSAIKQEVMTSSLPREKYSPLSVRDIPNEEPLDPSVNEWRLMHGTNVDACRAICGSNFRLKLAGTGATWKDAGADKGTPLYGYGVYLAESSTKADEYAESITGGLPIDEGCYAMLVCRVTGGLCRLVDTNEFDPNELRRDVLDGPYHSVFGDRVVKLGKPFREIVVHDNNQVFPEFILYYKRLGVPE
eukprot:TRINITY_DN5718_c0_g1_i1.p1 TRINITY_DN5718_c0_g1~~TRINITY_DN5718_c0_g1_i1.p1  ORF type:complete len:624 (-),score=58.48 TRINITY_DN5718_c0_g1_i1:234-2105(-)